MGKEKEKEEEQEEEEEVCRISGEQTRLSTSAKHSDGVSVVSIMAVQGASSKLAQDCRDEYRQDQ